MWKGLILAATLMGFAVAADAQNQCGPRELAMKQLEEKFDEVPVGIGVTNTGGLVELLQSRDETTWTIIITTPQGTTCLVAAGEDWRSSSEIPPSEKLEF